MKNSVLFFLGLTTCVSLFATENKNISTGAAPVDSSPRLVTNLAAPPNHSSSASIRRYFQNLPTAMIETLQMKDPEAVKNIFSKINNGSNFIKSWEGFHTKESASSDPKRILDIPEEAGAPQILKYSAPSDILHFFEDLPVILSKVLREAPSIISDVINVMNGATKIIQTWKDLTGITTAEPSVSQSIIKSPTKNLFGLIKSTPDQKKALREKLHGAGRHFSLEAASTEKAVNLKALTLPVELPNLKNYPSNRVYNQGNLGSCTANSCAFWAAYLSPNFEAWISRLFQYYNTRYHDQVFQSSDQKTRFNNMREDFGGTMDSAIRAVIANGFCPENPTTGISVTDPFSGPRSIVFNGWSYSDDEIQFTIPPSPDCYSIALNGDEPAQAGPSVAVASSLSSYKKLAERARFSDLTGPYERVFGDMNAIQQAQLKNAILTALSNNQPIWAGVSISSGNFNSSSMVFPLPDIKNIDSGHAIVIVGYGPYDPYKKGDKKTNYFKFQNSWGANWGEKGCGYLPEQYVLNCSKYGTELYAVSLSAS